MTLEARWVTSLDGLRSLGPRYDAMVRACGDAGLFYQLDWLEIVWPYYHLRLGGALSFLLAEEEGELVALAPLVLRTEGWPHARRRVLCFLGGTWDELDNWLPGFLFAAPLRRNPEQIMRLFADRIGELPWDLLDLRFVRPACPSRDVLAARFRHLRSSPDRLTTPRARLDRGWGDYWANRSGRLVRMLERGKKRAADEGLRIVHEVTPGVPFERRDEVESIHRARQTQVRSLGRARNSPFEDPLARQVFWRLIDVASSRGQVRTHWLRLGGRTAAYVIALHHARTTFAYFNAMDPAANRFHPGSLLLAGMIEREAQTYGAVVIDLMIGANLTKTLFATEELTNTRLTAVSGTVRSRAVDSWNRAARWIGRRLRQAG